MSEVDADQLKQAVESQHGGTAVFADAVPVLEVIDGKAVWEGVVHVYHLDDNPKATKPMRGHPRWKGSDRRRFYAVLHLGGIRSPLDAVRAAIVAEHRGSNDGSEE